MFNQFISLVQFFAVEYIEVIEDAWDVCVCEEQEEKVSNQPIIVEWQHLICVFIPQVHDQVGEVCGHDHVDEKYVGKSSSNNSKEFAMSAVELSSGTHSDHNTLDWIEDGHDSSHNEIQHCWRDEMLAYSQLFDPELQQKDYNESQSHQKSCSDEHP